MMKSILLMVVIFLPFFATNGICEQPVSIGVRSANDHVPFYIAQKLDLYRKEGISAVVKLFPSNTEIVEAMKRKEIQIGVFPISTAITAISNGVPIKIIAMTGKGSDGILVRKEDPIKSFSDLKGKKIATIRASILDLLLMFALEKEGLDPNKDVELRYFMTLGDMVAALKIGQVDATSNTEPFMTEAEMSGWGKILTYYTKYWPDHPCCVITGHREFLGLKPYLVKKVLKVHIDAVKYANSDLDFTSKTIAEYIGSPDIKIIKQSLSPEKMKISYEIDSKEVVRIAELLKRYKMIERLPSVEEMLDLTYLKGALKDRVWRQ
ncbi:MAG: ABC transporter substrate-binding protein [Deltaproteobacteria bacterium]|nr:ABC transporter substrate-binding protein [Deltaproteobacteria bacterium]